MFNKVRLMVDIMKGGEIMVDVYVALIIKGRRTFAQVPVGLQPAVKDTLLALGLDENGKPIA
jgi:hypothetical protein